MKGFLRSAIAVVVMMLLSMPLFALSSQAASTEASQIEQLKQEIEAIQRQNQKQIEELQKKIQDLEAKKETKVSSGEAFLKNFDAGYKEGLFIKTTDDKFSLKFNVLLQLYMPRIQDFSDNTNKAQDENIAFQVRRLRLVFSGSGFSP